MILTVKVPATSANLGPGFDCLGMALGLYNEFQIETLPETDRLEITVEGEGGADIPTDGRNLFVQAARTCAAKIGRPLPGLRIHQRNHVPSASGLGSSSTAVVAGLLAANRLLDAPLNREEILQIATDMEGHPDNVAPALYGGLVLVPMRTAEHDRLHVERIDIYPMRVVIVLPDFELLTADARAALPATVNRADAIFNLGRVPLVIRALETGDYEKLAAGMHDKLHQPYRRALIPGMGSAFTAVREAGAAAVAISGAGPSLIAFATDSHGMIGRAAVGAYETAGLTARMWELSVDHIGSTVMVVRP